VLVNKAPKVGEAIASSRLGNVVDECRDERERLKPFRFGFIDGTKIKIVDSLCGMGIKKGEKSFHTATTSYPCSVSGLGDFRRSWSNDPHQAAKIQQFCSLIQGYFAFIFKIWMRST